VDKEATKSLASALRQVITAGVFKDEGLLPTVYSNPEQGEIRNPSKVSGVAGQQSTASEQSRSGDYAIWDLEPVLSPDEGREARDMRVKGDHCDRG